MDDTSGEFFFALYYVTVPLLFGLITCSGVIGNSLVIHVILFRKRMRTVTNLLLLNLAFADLSFVLVIPPFTAYQFAADRWPFGDAACKLLHYLVNVTAYVTVYTLVLVAVIRYMTVVHSARTARFRTPSITIALIVGIWLLMSAVNTPVLLIYGAVRKTGAAMGRVANVEEDCDLYLQDYGRGLFATFFACGYVFPLAVIGLFSIQILHDIMRHRPQAPGLRRSKSIRRKKQIGRLLLLVVVVFAVLWLPVHIHLLVAFFGQIPTHKAYNAVSTLWHCLAYFNSCVNPVIYNHTSKEFRDAFSSTVSCFQALRPSASAATSVSAAAAGCKKENANHRTGKVDVRGALNRMRRSRNVVQKFQFVDGEEAGSPDRVQVVAKEDGN